MSPPPESARALGVDVLSRVGMLHAVLGGRFPSRGKFPHLDDSGHARTAPQRLSAGGPRLADGRKRYNYPYHHAGASHFTCDPHIRQPLKIGRAGHGCVPLEGWPGIFKAAEEAAGAKLIFVVAVIFLWAGAPCLTCILMSWSRAESRRLGPASLPGPLETRFEMVCSLSRQQSLGARLRVRRTSSYTSLTSPYPMNSG